MENGPCGWGAALPLPGWFSLLSPGCCQHHWHSCLGTSHRCCEDWEGIAAPPCQPWAVLLSPREPRTATHRGAQRRVQGTLLPLHAKSRHKQFLKCPRQVLRQAHVLKGLCISEKSVWPFSQAGKVRICI